MSITHLLELVGLVLAGAIAGWVNTIAGGGSMLTVPALMWYGLPADIANGTSRIAILAQGLTAVWGFRREKALDTSLLVGAAVPSVLGAVLGAYAATLIPTAIFKPILIITLLLMAASMFLKPDALSPPPGAIPVDPRKNGKAWVALFFTGFYGGFLQAGVGLILLAVFAGLCRIDLVRGNGLKVAVIFAYSIVVVLVFAGRGKMDWSSGGVLAIGHVLGAEFGVRFAVRQGQAAIRKVLFVVILVTCVSLFFK
jgi:uncharacterized membrane protein YfcA